MKKLLFAVFAHPDDEAFGPSGTLVLETRSGTELHLITLTNGAAGINSESHIELGTVRLAEWQAAAELIGATATHHLGYDDGCLCNTTLIDAQQRIARIVRDIASQHGGEYEVEFMTIDDNGITGHIDHTVASRAATHAYYTLKSEGLALSRIRYACVSRDMFPTHNIDWIYMPAGRSLSEINETVDARAALDTVRDIIRCHHSQRGDGEAHLAAHGDQVAVNHFIIRT
ncbi:hypothetical protein GII36_00720 [Candidatus Mycosynbacter amalyticus]|uniref:PIG-L family deacetylase n=1 Tax=Candidatus Mycosynbacter amalyticus TaxID=2665156 RepID=A0A857ML89_9BACT|nr:PIG-L deacetylase family protein [Candidatus Mycosynbacter amalyticus]QHN42382.1 hypothetical protein GII36_00720 [Candidatus Mycosynbacter amalyticus]